MPCRQQVSIALSSATSPMIALAQAPQPLAHHSINMPQAHPGQSTTLLAFLAGAMVGAAIVATSTWPDLPKWWTRRQKHLVEEVHQPLAPLAAAVEALEPQDWLHDDILGEQFTRNVQFFGEASQRQIANAFVVVIGLGVSAVAPARRGCGPDWWCMLGDMRPTLTDCKVPSWDTPFTAPASTCLASCCRGHLHSNLHLQCLQAWDTLCTSR